MLFHVNPSSGVPIYAQIEIQVKNAIAAGAVKQGHALPSVRKLAAELGINPTTTPHGGSGMAMFNSYDASSGAQTRLYQMTGFAIPSTATSATLKFWMYHDTGYSADADRVQVQAGTGATWTNVGTAINRYDGSTGWKQHTIDLTAYKGQTIQLGFLGISVFGNNVFIDDAVVTTP